jgi:DNA-binding NarL/FixJ family response regulator
MIRILLADDHPLVLSALERLLGGCPDMEVVATATGGVEAVTLASQCDPDVVLMDLSMPDLDGAEATRQILESNPRAHVVMLTSFADRDDILRTIDAGAVGYLLKDADPDELLRGIRAAARGESPVSSKAASALVAARSGARNPEPELSAREREVLALVVDGFANKQIGQQLRISEKTVKAHLTSIFQRLGVADRTQAALWAQKRGAGGGKGARQP